MKNIVVNHYKILIVLTLTNLVAQWVTSFQIVEQPLDTQEWKNNRVSRNLRSRFFKSSKINPNEDTFTGKRTKNFILTSKDWGDPITSSESSNGVSGRKSEPKVGLLPRTPLGKVNSKEKDKLTSPKIPERSFLKRVRSSSLWQWGKRKPPPTVESGKDSSQASPETSEEIVLPPTRGTKYRPSVPTIPEDPELEDAETSQLKRIPSEKIKPSLPTIPEDPELKDAERSQLERIPTEKKKPALQTKPEGSTLENAERSQLKRIKKRGFFEKFAQKFKRKRKDEING
ncbi:unnamed protein product [Albugo candida]|uniref:RxLR effector protein n=1 Tax=Albugo candida TaxID=65357 RepID=A0A024GFE4_9STRA|nr:unnamed protein product [Albugo candida]|eukprot:CCI45604.1 unnamed protein product [Albugo candida]